MSTTGPGRDWVAYLRYRRVARAAGVQLETLEDFRRQSQITGISVGALLEQQIATLARAQRQEVQR